MTSEEAMPTPWAPEELTAAREIAASQLERCGNPSPTPATVRSGEADQYVHVQIALTAGRTPAHLTTLREAREALADMLAGWEYIRKHHGRLYGVGWDRCEQSATASLATLDNLIEKAGQ